MALKATIYKAELQIADMDRHYYGNHTLTLARHPSETDERMMVRLLAYVIHAHEDMLFGKGISTDEEPDIWKKDLSGTIECWIEVGTPDEKRVVKATRRAQQVLVYTYSHSSTVWWKQAAPRLEPLDNLTVLHLPSAQSADLTKLAQRNMSLQCTIQEGQIWISDSSNTAQIELLVWKPNKLMSRK